MLRKTATGNMCSVQKSPGLEELRRTATMSVSYTHLDVYKRKTEPLADIMDAILEGTDGEIAVDNADISQDRFSWFFGVDAIEGAEGYSSEAMIGSIAHSVALLRVPDGTDAVKLAGEIKNSVDPRKWICVEAEKTIVKQYACLLYTSSCV